MTWEFVLFLIVSGILAILLIIEARGYGRFLAGAKQLESYIIQYNANADKITNALKEVGEISATQLRTHESAFKDLSKLERNMEIIIDVLSLHSEALNIKSTLQFQKLLEKVGE